MQVLQVCSGIATLALLMGSGAGFVAVRLGQERARWGWRGGAMIGVAALLLGLILRGVTTSAGWWPLSSVAGRAALVALIAGLLSVASELRNPVSQEPRPRGGAELMPLVVVAGVSAVGRAAENLTAAPVLVVCTLVAAGLGLWSAGQGLGVLVGHRKDNRPAAAMAFAGLTASVVVVGGVNWRLWGTPVGAVTASLGLLASWLVSAARPVLHRKSIRLAGALDLLVALLLVGVGLSVQWALPFD